MLSARFEPAIPASKRLQTLDRAATGIGRVSCISTVIVVPKHNLTYITVNISCNCQSKLVARKRNGFAFERITITVTRLRGLSISSVPTKGSAVAGPQDPYTSNSFPIISCQLRARELDRT
jgi:hypothetical protein